MSQIRFLFFIISILIAQSVNATNHEGIVNLNEVAEAELTLNVVFKRY